MVVIIILTELIFYSFLDLSLIYLIINMYDISDAVVSVIFVIIGYILFFNEKEIIYLMLEILFQIIKRREK